MEACACGLGRRLVLCLGLRGDGQLLEVLHEHLQTDVICEHRSAALLQGHGTRGVRRRCWGEGIETADTKGVRGSDFNRQQKEFLTMKTIYWDFRGR